MKFKYGSNTRTFFRLNCPIQFENQYFMLLNDIGENISSKEGLIIFENAVFNIGIYVRSYIYQEVYNLCSTKRINNCERTQGE